MTERCFYSYWRNRAQPPSNAPCSPYCNSYHQEWTSSMTVVIRNNHIHHPFWPHLVEHHCLLGSNVSTEVTFFFFFLSSCHKKSWKRTGSTLLTKLMNLMPRSDIQRSSGKLSYLYDLYPLSYGTWWNSLKFSIYAKFIHRGMAVIFFYNFNGYPDQSIKNRPFTFPCRGNLFRGGCLIINSKTAYICCHEAFFYEENLDWCLARYQIWVTWVNW